MALITLTSDLGLQNYLAGSVKGQLWKIHPDFRIVDISHSVIAFNVSRAAYICRNALNHFPANTFHIWLINLFDNKQNHLLIARHNQQYIACADNALLPLTIEGKPDEVIMLPIPEGTPKNLIEYTRLFGEAILHISEGKPLTTLGANASHLKYNDPLSVRTSGNSLEAKVIFIDSYENVILNIHRTQFETLRNGRKFQIVLKGNETINRISDSYADVPEGEKLALFNASGYMEIAINKGNASGLLGLQLYSDTQDNISPNFLSRRLMYQTVIIEFID
ncbi:MAG TPA: SAM-dependent chlorinase/fluorinase [Ferruginibacter sp.]|nr:SAM-dependent chlorinase/fluorinase [Ferruginibacter sp.]HRO17985.1 SAM-dependent chlorinase/fluorinase [Ferruginibacter sp.]HRQ21317.1 SAM-dependent chlorinase/fluorinase [Ferruginibacter sp.]